MGPLRVGRPGLSEELILRAREWAERSCMDQQLPVKITDPATLARVARLLGAVPAGVRREAEPAGRASEEEAAPGA